MSEPGDPVIEMIPQRRGGKPAGSLQRGNPGNLGRPRRAVRLAALLGAERAVPRLIEILDDPEADRRDVIAAARALLEYGLGRQVEIEDVTPAPQMAETGETVRQRLMLRLTQVYLMAPEGERAEALRRLTAGGALIEGDRG